MMGMHGLHLIEQIRDIANKEHGQRSAFPTLNTILGKGKEPKQNHCYDHHAKIHEGNTLDAHW